MRFIDLMAVVQNRGQSTSSGEHSLLCRRSFGSSRNPPHRGEGTRDEALRTSGREAMENMICLPLSRVRPSNYCTPDVPLGYANMCLPN